MAGWILELTRSQPSLVHVAIEVLLSDREKDFS